MDAPEVKQKVFDLLEEQRTLGMANNAKFVDLIYKKFGKVCTEQQVATARTDLKALGTSVTKGDTAAEAYLKIKKDVIGIPMPEKDTK